MLSSLAARVEDSRGRRYPEAAHAYRDDYQRDRDRVVHSRAFRRMENKTQVFTRRYSDHFRNRLTHTIEVAQISRTIAASLGLNADLVEALALVHDIGHPPFGHAGEKALDAAMRAHGLSFDHNLHALRIVEHFEQRYAAFPGLNLTFEVREGIIKHSRDYDAAAFPELAEYALDLRPPLEAQLIDLTDEIAYNTADLDDGFEAHILRLDEMTSHVLVFARFYDKARGLYPGAREKLLFNEALKRVLNHMVGDLITNTARRVRQAGVQRLDEVRAYPQRLVAFSEEVENERRLAKAFLYDHLYYSEALKPEKAQAELVTTEVFDYFVSHAEELPQSYREQAEREPLPRVVCDYVAGMTDNFILDQHQKMMGASGDRASG